MTTTMDEKHEYIVRSKLDPMPIPNCSVGELIKQQIDLVDPNRIALIDASTERKLSYGQLEQQANQIASALIDLGISNTKPVMFYADDSIEYIIVNLALLYLGVTISPSSPANGPFETGQQLAGLEATVLIVSKKKLATFHQMMEDMEKYGKLISDLQLLIVLDAEEDQHQSLVNSIGNHRNSPKLVVSLSRLLEIGKEKKSLIGKKVPYFPIEDSQSCPFLIIYTSGTTGLPKGAILSHRSFVASLLSGHSTSGKMDGWTFGMVYTFGHLAGSAYLIIGLLNRLTGILFTEYSHKLYLGAIERYHIQWVPMLPGFCLELYQTDQTKHYDLSSIKLISYGGSKYSRHWIETVRERYRVPTVERYSSTEFFRSVTNLEPDHPFGSVGTPVANVEMKIIDPTSSGNCSLPANREGELCLRGPNCFIGYLNNPEATRETIDPDGWYHSGDVGYYDDEGRLYITDRIKELIKYKHWSVAPTEIEEFLQTHRAVAIACVVGVRHETEGAHLRAYVTLRDGIAVTEQQLIDYVKENMGYQKRLNGGVQFVSHIPRSIVDKVDRKYFRNLVRDEVLTKPAEVV